MSQPKSHLLNILSCPYLAGVSGMLAEYLKSVLVIFCSLSTSAGLQKKSMFVDFCGVKWTTMPRLWEGEEDIVGPIFAPKEADAPTFI